MFEKSFGKGDCHAASLLPIDMEIDCRIKCDNDMEFIRLFLLHVPRLH